MRNTRKVFQVCLLFSLIIIAVFLWAKRDTVYDWQRLRNYIPTNSIQQLASETTMTSYARHMFYVNHPVIEDKSAFNTSCPNDGGEQTIVLGCYHSHETGIFIYDVTDSQLNGVEQVTAAHETLHAIYERLSPGEKQKVDKLLTDYYQNDLKDKRILDTINSYKQTEPNDVVDEMHSVFGTEILNLPKALEDYYAKFFSDRKKIAAYAASYQQAFTSRDSQIAQYDQQLKSLAGLIDTNKQSLDQMAQDLSNERAQVDRTSSTQVDAFNQSIVAYNNLLAQTNGYIDQYNLILAQRNSLAVEEQQLYKAINSKLAPQAAQ